MKLGPGVEIETQILNTKSELNMIKKSELIEISGGLFVFLSLHKDCIGSYFFRLFDVNF